MTEKEKQISSKEQEENQKEIKVPENKVVEEQKEDLSES